MKYLINFSYDGSFYDGYQKQINKPTVQKNIEEVLSKRFNKEIHIYASGRTDKGVHAINQYAHFDCEENDLNKLKIYLNDNLDSSIYIKSIKMVDDNFHARKSAKKKIYTYIINTGDYCVFKKNYEYQYNKKINMEKINDLIPYFLGKHDFTNFTTVQDKKESYEREIYDLKIEETSRKAIITISGNGFLRYMVRNIVGSIIMYNEGKLNKKDIIDMINNKTSKKPTKIDAVGLYLKDVEY